MTSFLFWLPKYIDNVFLYCYIYFGNQNKGGIINERKHHRRKAVSSTDET